jgi:hypothetical protein
MRTALVFSCLTALAAATHAPAPAIASANDLVDAMQKQYGSSWYKTATFVQKTSTFAPDGTVSKVETWYEAMTVPGSLRIDFAPVKDGNGILFTDGKVYNFKDGKVATSRDYIHPLMVLGFDIYRLPKADVIAKLTSLKFDLSIFHDDTWQGRPVYVVGAPKGDAHAAQFWIDKEHLYFVRMLRPSGTDNASTSETQFNKYQRLGGGWMSPEVVFTVDGKLRTKEEYTEIRGDVALDAKLFDPQYWTTVHWRE